MNKIILIFVIVSAVISLYGYAERPGVSAAPEQLTAEQLAADSGAAGEQ